MNKHVHTDIHTNYILASIFVYARRLTDARIDTELI